VQRLTGPGDAFEREGLSLLVDALWPPDYSDAHTRSQLKHLDNEVAKAAAALRDALKIHPDFCSESAAANWPEDDAKRTAAAIGWLLEQLHSNNEDRLWTVREECMRRLSPDNVDLPRLLRVRRASHPSRAGDFFSFVAVASPTMPEMLDVLTRRAKNRAAQRFVNKKRRQTTGAAYDAQFMRHLLASLISRHPSVTPGQAARIITPVVDKALGTYKVSTTFSRCKKAAQEIRRDMVVNGECVWFLGRPHVAGGKAVILRKITD
jgi:hypothetical protein